MEQNKCSRSARMGVHVGPEYAGITAANGDPDNNGKKFIFNLRFAGQYYDAETELHYNYFRDYDPSTGRYVQSDRIGLDGGLNTYGYVGSNPVNFTDPYGLLPYMPLPGFGSSCGSGPSTINIPDSFGRANFTSACNRHDECYGTCGANKGECDRVFYNQMLKECSKYGTTGGCAAAARAYYEAVSRSGSDSYNKAQKEACDSCGK